MKIQVLGSGCASCKRLLELTQKAVKELGVTAEVEYITDMKKIVEMNVMQTPILAIDGKPVRTGSMDLETIMNLISDNCCKPSSSDRGTCSCGGK